MHKLLAGHDCTSTQWRGWGGIKNGDLIRLAEEEFDIFVTSDQNIRYPQNLAGRRIAILGLSTNDLRRILAAGVEPNELLWVDDASEPPLFAGGPPVTPNGPAPKVSAAFLDMARTAAAHNDPRRWGLLYRLLWRLTRGGEPHLLGLPTDPDLRQVQQWSKAVGREIHKMHAFVRFRLIGNDEASGREQFVAWFEPGYRIVRLASPFFLKRYAGMDWPVLTPLECAHWDGKTLTFTPGVPRGTAPAGDALDELWRTYYRSIFNPARVKVQAMQSEMPRKYWKNLPEAPLIPELLSGSRKRVQTMLESEELPVKPAPPNAYLDALRKRNEGEATRTD